MKRLSLLVSMFAMIGYTALAQQPNHPRSSAVITKSIAIDKQLHFDAARPTIDTFGNLQPCDSLFYIYTFNYGFVDGVLSGHNIYLDSAKAEQYQGVPGTQIDALWCFFGYASYSNSTQAIHVKVWDATGAGGSPGAELGNVNVTHQSINADVAAGNLTTVTFSSPITMPAGGNFYAGFSMDYKKKGGVMTYDSTRIVALANPDLSSACADSASNTAWEQWTSAGGAGGGWHTYWESYGVGTRNPVFPIVESSSCTVTITPSSGDVCKGKTIALSASVSPAGGTWTWSPSDGLNVTTGDAVNAKPKHTTTYTATNSQGCSADVTITVNPKPTSSVTQDPCSAGHILLHSNANPNTGVTYKWYLNGSAISGATNDTYDATVSGNYKVKVKITATGCSKSSKQVSVTIGCKLSDNNATAFNASATPNPFSQSLNLSISSASNEAATVTLLDFIGRTITTFTGVDVSAPFEINQNLTPGVYFIKVEQGANSKMIKVVKSE